MISGIFSSSTQSQFLDCIFDPALWTVLSHVAPLPFSLVQHLPSPTFPVYRGVSSCVGLRDWPESESTKLLDQWPSQDKITGEEGGLSQIKSCRQVPFQVTFQMKTFCTAFWVLSFYEQDLRIWTHLASCAADIQEKQSSVFLHRRDIWGQRSYLDM
jgi:hypothetical protein